MITYIIHKIKDNKIVGRITKYNNGKYIAECLVDKDDKDYPVALFGLNKEIKKDDQDVIRFWLEDRVVPRTRQGLEMLLESVGMEHWDLEQLLELNQGKCSNDYFYLEIINENIQSE